MVVGFDYWNTISQNVNLFSSLASSIISEGGKVYIISAVGSVRIQTTQAAIEQLGIPNDGIILCEFKHPSEAPQLKLAVCQSYGIQMFFDDRRDICELLNKNGILACNVLKGHDFVPANIKTLHPVQ